MSDDWINNRATDIQRAAAQKHAAQIAREQAR
jgi:hypothetical protein